MTERKIPLRKCLGCGEMKEKRALLRVVKCKDGSTVADPTGKVAGRGAYICKSVACFDAARKNRRFEKAFSEKIPEAVYDDLRQSIDKLTDAESDRAN